MNNERKDPGQDQLVTETYKALARERVPDHLNERVLRLAADAGRTRYARARAWMRPAAWAATVGLSLAIVLELTQLPETESLPVGITSSDQDSAAGEAANDNEMSAEMRKEAPSPELQSVRGDVQPGVPAAPVAKQQDPEAARQFAPKDMSVLREAEDRARLQAGPDRPSAAIASEAMQDLAETDDTKVDEIVVDVAVHDEETAAEPAADFAAARSLAAVVEKKAATADPQCPSETREKAEAWNKCIEELRDRGFDELANSEYEAFQRIFPDFVDPGTDR